MPNMRVQVAAESSPKVAALINLIDEAALATSIIKTVWLAMTSPNYDSNDDVEDVKEVVYLALGRMETIGAAFGAANDEAIADAVQRAAP
jgi:hypothetical protein